MSRGALPWLWAALALHAVANHAQACDEHVAAIRPARPSLGWSWDPLALLVLSVSFGVYTLGVWRLWRHAGVGHGIGVRHVLAFAASLGSLVLALLSPLDSLSDVLFSAHMSQHELLMVVAAPLMVVARPWIALSWAIPTRPRRVVYAWTRRPTLQRAWRAATSPIVALALHAFALWVWHVPALFEAALRNEAVHAVQHAMFFGSAALFFWTLMCGRFGRAGYGAAAFFVFATALHSGVLGALLTVAERLWYPLQEARARAFDLAPLQDQQLAGLIMWVPAGAVLLMIALALFAAWLGESERRALAAERRRAADRVVTG